MVEVLDGITKASSLDKSLLIMIFGILFFVGKFFVNFINTTNITAKERERYIQTQAEARELKLTKQLDKYAEQLDRMNTSLEHNANTLERNTIALQGITINLDKLENMKTDISKIKMKLDL